MKAALVAVSPAPSARDTVFGFAAGMTFDASR